MRPGREAQAVSRAYDGAGPQSQGKRGFFSPVSRRNPDFSGVL